MLQSELFSFQNSYFISIKREVRRFKYKSFYLLLEWLKNSQGDYEFYWEKDTLKG